VRGDDRDDGRSAGDDDPEQRLLEAEGCAGADFLPLALALAFPGDCALV